MKSFLTFLSLILSLSIYSQNLTQQQWQQIQNEAYYDWLNKNNGYTQGWQQVRESYTKQYYQRNYQSNSANPSARKKTYKSGTFLSNQGAIGSYSNGYILNSYNQSLGYVSKGYYMSSSNQCIGFIKGYQIFNCQGHLLATVKSNGIYNAQGYLIYGLNGETLYKNNYPHVQISGLTMENLAAYLLFF
jgi:hypothetical protein